MEKKIYVTEEGFNQYMAELERHRSEREEHLRTIGDYGFNTQENPRTSAYDAELATIDSMIVYLEGIIDRLEVVTKQHSTDGRIGLDDIVTFQHLDGDGHLRSVQLTGLRPNVFAEGNIMKITPNSPVGKCLMGAKVGEIRKYKAGRPEQEYVIKIISKESTMEQSRENLQPGQE